MWRRVLILNFVFQFVLCQIKHDDDQRQGEQATTGSDSGGVTNVQNVSPSNSSGDVDVDTRREALEGLLANKLGNFFAV